MTSAMTQHNHEFLQQVKGPSLASCLQSKKLDFKLLWVPFNSSHSSFCSKSYTVVLGPGCQPDCTKRHLRMVGPNSVCLWGHSKKDLSVGQWKGSRDPLWQWVSLSPGWCLTSMQIAIAGLPSSYHVSKSQMPFNNTVIWSIGSVPIDNPEHMV